MSHSRLIQKFVYAMGVCTALASAQQYTSLFNGENLDGWTVLGNGSWEVQDSAIIASQPARERDFTHLIHDMEVEDFELTFLFKNPKGNAGCFFRLEQTTPQPAGVSGVQVVIDVGKNDNTMFGFYETNGRGWLKQWNHSQWNSIFDDSDWNRLTIVAEGSQLLLKLNTETIVEVDDPMGRKEGKIAFKLHGGRDGEAHFKDIKIRPLGVEVSLPHLKPDISKNIHVQDSQLSLSLQGKYTLRISDTRGRPLHKSSHVGSSKHDLSALSGAGIVFLHLQAGSAQITKPLVLLARSSLP